MNWELNDHQWALVAPVMPPRKCRGRPRADDRRVLGGILYVLRTGCRWQDMPVQYSHPSTVWRRLRRWQEEGVWEDVWRTLLQTLDEQGKLEWNRAFLDGSFVPAKKGEKPLASPGGAKAANG